MLFKQGADVKQINGSSGHASRNDLQMMINVLQPEYFIHSRWISCHEFKAAAAEEVNVAPDHIMMAMKGDQFTWLGDHFELKDSFTIGKR